MATERQRLEVNELDSVNDYWPGSGVTPTQISPGPLNLVLDGVADSEFGVVQMSVAPKIVDRACCKPGQYGFMLAKRPSTWCGMDVPPDTLVINQPGRESCSVLTPNFRSLELFFSSATLADEMLGSLLEESRLTLARSLVPLTPAAAQNLRAAAQVFIETAPGSPTADACHHQLARSRLLKALTTIVAQHLHAPEKDLPTGSESRSALVFAALHKVDQIGAATARVSDLQSCLGVSRRALEKSFDRMLDVSPGQYLLARRLHDLRSRLNSGKRSVCDNAFAAGLQDPSRAARQYRRLFGELPSQTLSRARGAGAAAPLGR